MWETVAEAHAALNDLPATLLVLAVLLDLAGVVTGKESLKSAGFWSLMIGAVGTLAAVTTGLLAEDSIEHGPDIHRLMERHETLAITATVIFISLASWRIWRHGLPGGRERTAYLVISGLGALLILWVSHIGGNIVFRHAGGIPGHVLQSSLEDREQGHSHGPGEEHEHEDEDTHGPAIDADAPVLQDSSGGAEHSHPPGTPPHKH